MMIRYVYEGKVWPAVLVQELGAGAVELKFFPAAAEGLGSVVDVARAEYDEGKSPGTWHHGD